MKVFTIVILALTISARTNGDYQQNNSANLTYKNDGIFLNKGEFIPKLNDNSDKYKGYDEQFGYNLKSKKITLSSLSAINKNFSGRSEVLPPKKTFIIHKTTKILPYSIKRSSTPYRKVYKPKRMTAKVVQKGSVQHIYLDIPDVEPAPRRPKPSTGYDHTRPDYGNKYKDQVNTYEDQHLYNQPIMEDEHMFKPQSVPHIPVPMDYNNPGSNNLQTAATHGFNSFSNGFESGKYNNLGNYESQFDYTGSSDKFRPSPLLHNTPFKGIRNPSFHSSYHNFQNNKFNDHQYPVNSDDFHGFEGEESQQAYPGHGNGYSFAQYSIDGKEKYRYEIPKEYQNMFPGHQQGQPTDLVSKVVNNYQKPYEEDRDFGNFKISNFEQESTNIKPIKHYESDRDFGNFKISNFEEESTNLNPIKNYESDRDYGSYKIGNFEQESHNIKPLKQYEEDRDFGNFKISNFEQETTNIKPHKPISYRGSSDFIPKATANFGYKTKPSYSNSENYDTIKASYAKSSSEYLPKPETYTQKYQFMQYPETYKQQESAEFLPKPEAFTQPLEFLPKPEAYTSENQNEATSYSQSSNYITHSLQNTQPQKFTTESDTSSSPSIDLSNNYHFNIQEQDNQEANNSSNVGLENSSGYNHNLLNMVKNVLNTDQGVTTKNGFRVVKSKEDNAIYLVGQPGMSLDTVPNLNGFVPSDFKINLDDNNNSNPS